MGLRIIYQELNNLAIHKGTIPTIYIGGAFQSIQNVQNYAKASAAYTHTIMIDLLGFGDSDILESSYKMEILADSIIHFVEEKGFEKVNLVGTSYGAVVSYIIAGKSPELLNRMVLGGFMDKFDEQTLEIWQQGLWYAKNGRRPEFSEHMSALLLNKSRESEIRLQSYISSMMVRKLLGATYAELDKFIFSIERLMANKKTFPAPQCPTLMMTGEFDSFTTPAHHKKLHDLAPQSTYTLINNADHMFHLEQFDVTTKLISNFMQNGSIASVPGHRSHQSKLSPELV